MMSPLSCMDPVLTVTSRCDLCLGHRITALSYKERISSGADHLLLKDVYQTRQLPIVTGRPIPLWQTQSGHYAAPVYDSIAKSRRSRFVILPRPDCPTHGLPNTNHQAWDSPDYSGDFLDPGKIYNQNSHKRHATVP